MSQDLKRKAAEAQLSALPLPQGESGWAHETRARARARLLEAGAPARRDEYWKYTEPSRLTAPLAMAAADATSNISADAFRDAGALSYRFVNGRLRSDLSDGLSSPHIAMGTLSDALSQDISVMQSLFGTLEQAGQEMVSRPLAILNTAAATEGLVFQATGEAPRPVHIHYEQIGEGTSMLRHLVRVESGAKMTLLESGVASNVVWEIDLADGAELHHIRLQKGTRIPHVTHLFARLGSESQFKTFSLTADGEMTRNEIVMELVGDEAQGHIAGAVLAKGTAHIDNTVFVTHDAVNCESRQVFKNVLANEGHAVFQGKIYVKEGAQKTDGYQISQAVLLNDGAEFLAKPELEIYADDVACSHGSTTGALDATAMFYLQSRGVLRADAEAMLIAAFAEEAINEIASDDFRDLMRDEVAQWMAERA